MKNAIVTGASGFVGKYLVGELLENGYRVLAVIRDADKIDGAAKYWYRGGAYC